MVGVVAMSLNVVFSLVLTGLATAQPDEDSLVVNDETELATEVAAPAHLDGALGSTIYSGWRFRTDETYDRMDETRAMFAQNAVRRDLEE